MPFESCKAKKCLKIIIKMVRTPTDSVIGSWDIMEEVMLFRLDRSIVIVSRWLLTYN